MKLFSRKALVAAATAATVSLSGVTVATAETATNEEPAVVDNTTNEDAGKDAPEGDDNGKDAPEGDNNGKDGDSNNDDTTNEESSSSSSSDDSEGSSISDMKPSEIRDWIAVFTAIIGALGTVFAFYNKNFAK